jgi:hypothetical protein
MKTRSFCTTRSAPVTISMAIEELSRTFGDNYGFFADGPPAERLAALEQWQQLIGGRPDLDL